MPFVIDALKQTCRYLMNMFLRRSVVDEACTPHQFVMYTTLNLPSCVASSKKQIHELDITNSVVTACKSAHSKYTAALKAGKKEREDRNKNKKRKLLDEEIVYVKRRRTELVSCVDMLNRDIKCCDEAEKHVISFAS